LREGQKRPHTAYFIPGETQHKALSTFSFVMAVFFAVFEALTLKVLGIQTCQPEGL
jgi:hypothetical protein